MATYRVYFLTADGVICGREDFEADDDQSTWATAQTVFEAGSDLVQRFELWCGIHLVLCPQEPIKLGNVQAGRRRAVVELEEHIRDSRWAIASSQQLMRRLSEYFKA
jgi:hypothetical protein